MFDIKHCGECEKFITFCQKHQTHDDLIFYDMHHCKNLEKINNIFSYLGYHYFDMMTKYDNKYITPTLTIKSGYLDIGATKYEDYNDLDFFLEQGFHKYIIIGEGGIGKSIFLSKLFYSLIVKSIKSECRIIPVLTNCDYFGRDDTTPQEWLNDMIKKKFPYFPMESIIHDQNKQVIFIIDALNSLQYKNKQDYHNKIALWAQFVEEYCELYPNVSFVISSREISELDSFDSNDEKLIYLSPLEFNKIERFIRLFVNNQESITKLNNLVTNHSDMHFIGVPFFLKKLIETQKNDAPISNKTEIVLLYLKTLFDKKDKGIDVYGVSKRVDSYFGEIKVKDIKIYEISFFKVMCISAFTCQKQNKKVLNENDIESICNMLNVESIDMILVIALEERIMIKNGSVYVFSHPILQEVMAALYIHASLEGDYNFNDIISFTDSAMNMEVLPHLYNMQNKKSYFIDTLINNNELILAAECVINNGEELKNRVANAIINYLENSKEKINIEDIYNLGLYLGLIGDSRFNLNGKYIEPPLSRITMLNNLSVAIYPITNSEFKKFIDDGGYSNDVYWSEANEVNWLSDKTGKKYRLLNHFEWETISRAKARKYVFDEEICDTNCNTIQSKINGILPVGALYKNRTPEGIFDLNGNIFEWTDSIYKNNNDPLQKQYIVKGGSWMQRSERATSIYVGRAKAWCRNPDVGFRVCLDESN